MATEIYSIIGQALWAKVFERNRDTESKHPGVQQKLDQTDGQTSITLLMDEEGLAEFESSGSRRKVDQLDDGPAVQFTRPWKHRIEAFGGAPRVVDADGNIWDDSVAIGNGSLVEVAFSVYDTSMGKGTRLEAIRVINLVEHEESNAPKLPF